MAKRLKWGTIEHLQELIDQYFATAAAPNIAGLCIALNIHRDTWYYYTTEQWRYDRKEIEMEVKLQQVKDTAAAGLYEVEPVQVEDEGNIEDDSIKQRVTDILKKAHDKLDDVVSTQIFQAKNPAGPIFYAKAALGYRETEPDQQQQQTAQTKIEIVVLPASSSSNIIEIEPVKPKELPQQTPVK